MYNSEGKQMLSTQELGHLAQVHVANTYQDSMVLRHGMHGKGEGRTARH